MREIISTFKNLPKHLKTAFVGIWRNWVMSTAAIFTVTITMSLIGIFGLLAINVNTISSNIEKGVQIYVKLDRGIDSNREKEIGQEISKISGVKTVTYSSKDDELKKFIEKQDDKSAQLFENYKKDNPLGSAYIVQVKDPMTIDKVAKTIEEISNVNTVNYGGDATNKMIKSLQTIRNVGSVLIIALVVIATLVISTTIKMTITARQTEIGIMRLVGASNMYIRVPFMFEGMLIGLIGSILPVALIIYGYRFIYSYAGGSFVTNALQLASPVPLVRNVSFGIALLGAIVGLFGSYLSMRKFLKL